MTDRKFIMTDRKFIEKEVREPLVRHTEDVIPILDLEMWCNNLKREGATGVKILLVTHEQTYEGEVHLQGICEEVESDAEYAKRMLRELNLGTYVSNLAEPYKKKVAELQVENGGLRANAMELTKENDELRYKIGEGTKEGSLSKTPLLDKDTPIGSLQAELLELKQRRDQIVGYLSDIYEEEDREIYIGEWWNGN